MRTPECHPDKQHAAHGLCRACYYRESRSLLASADPGRAQLARDRHAAGARRRRRKGWRP